MYIVRTILTKIVREAIMKPTELQNKYLKNNTDIILKAYKKESNFCDKLYKKERKKYYSKLHVNSITEIENFGEPLTHFWVTKLLLSLKYH